MRCPVCGAPLVHDPSTGESFCNADPDHSYVPPEPSDKPDSGSSCHAVDLRDRPTVACPTPSTNGDAGSVGAPVEATTEVVHVS